MLHLIGRGHCLRKKATTWKQYYTHMCLFTRVCVGGGGGGGCVHVCVGGGGGTGNASIGGQTTLQTNCDILGVPY